jgi:hypothetical protein
MSVALSESRSPESPIVFADHAKRTTGIGQRIWTPYLYLLWREWRNLRWWFPASLGLTLMIMLLFVLSLTDLPLQPEDFGEFQTLLFLQSMFTPIIFLLGALAGCFANEREDSSFQWGTTLPIHWAQSWSMKLLCTAGGAIFCWVIGWYFATLLAGWLPRPLRWSVELEAFYRANSDRSLRFSYLKEVSFVIYSIALVCILVSRRVASGSLAAVAFGGLYVFLSLWMIFIFGGYESTQLRGDLSLGDLRRVLANPWLCGGVLLAIATGLYRWRWYTGMYAELSPIRQLALPISAEQNVVDAWLHSWSAPNQLQALLWLAGKKAAHAWIWLPLAVGAVVVGNHARGEYIEFFSILTPLGMLFLVVFTGLSSIWSFCGERGGESESFLAERGVSPTRFWWSRYLVTVVGSMVVLCGTIIFIWIVESLSFYRSFPYISQQEQLPFFTILVLGIHAFALSCLLAGQTTRTWQLAAFAVATGFIVMTFFVDVAVRSSGYWGLGVNFCLITCSAPLSWWMTRDTLVRWQPRLDWVFPTYAAVVLLVIVLTIPWVRVWVLPPAATELATARSLPAHQIPRLTLMGASSIHEINQELTRNQRFDFRGLVELRTEELARQQLADLDSSQPSVAVVLRASSELARQRLMKTIEHESARVAVLDEKFPWAEWSDLRLCLRNLAEIAFAALEIGDSETAAVSLQLRRRLLDELRPVTGTHDFDALQASFFEAIEREASGEAMQRLKVLHRQQPTLLAGDPEQARKAWTESMQAQFSYLYRRPRGSKTSTVPNAGDASTTSLMASDELLGQTVLARSFRERMNLLKLILPEAWWYSAEEARFQREIGYAYQIFLDYLRTDHLTVNSMPYNPDFGELNSQHNLLKQIEAWDNQRKAWVRLLARIDQLPEGPESR